MAGSPTVRGCTPHFKARFLSGHRRKRNCSAAGATGELPNLTETRGAPRGHASWALAFSSLPYFSPLLIGEPRAAISLHILPS